MDLRIVALVLADMDATLGIVALVLALVAVLGSWSLCSARLRKLGAAFWDICMIATLLVALLALVAKILRELRVG